MNDKPLEQEKDKHGKYKHWKLSTDIDKVLWLTIDREGENVNSLSLEVLSELERIIEGLETNVF